VTNRLHHPVWFQLEGMVSPKTSNNQPQHGCLVHDHLSARKGPSNARRFNVIGHSKPNGAEPRYKT
jgi:hypothetical protein